MTYVSEVAADTPLTQLRLGETTGSTAADASGNSHPGSYVGTVTLNQAGAITGDSNKAVAFGGAGSLSVPLDLSALNKITVEFWLKTELFAADGAMGFEFTTNGAGTGGFSFIFNGTTGQFEAHMGGHTVYFVRPRMRVFRHFVVEFDRTVRPSQNSISLWIDGVRAQRARCTDSAAVGGTFANSTLYFMSRGGTSLFFNGTLDEVAVYTGLLSQVRIKTHKSVGTPPVARQAYNLTVLADSSILYQRFAESSGTTAADETAGNHDGTYSGTAVLDVASPLKDDNSGAVAFNGAGGISTPIDLSAYNKLTIEFWLLWPKPAAGSNQMILEYGSNGKAAGGFSLSNIGGTGQVWRVDMGTASAAEFGNNALGTGIPSNGNPPSYDTWHHIVIELDRTTGPVASGPINLWVDAVVRSKTATSGPSAEGGNFGNLILNMMRRADGSLGAIGTIDELAIYSGLLTQEQIDAHYLAATKLDWIHSGTRPLDINTVFPAPNIWRDPLPAVIPAHSSSYQWTSNLISQLGLNSANRDANPVCPPLSGVAGDPGFRSIAYSVGAPSIYVVPANQPRVPMANGYVLLNNGSAWDRMFALHDTWMAGVPIPDHAITDSSGDHNLVIFCPDTNEYWEFWLLDHTFGVEPISGPGLHGRPYQWKCYGGAYMPDVTTYAGTYRDVFDPVTGKQTLFYFDGTTATSLPFAGGAITREEFNDEQIDHALQMIVGNAWTTFVYPAHRGDGQNGPTWIPEGAWLRISPDYDPSIRHPNAAQGGTYNQRKVRTLVDAAQKYGIFITDKTARGCAIRFRCGPSYVAEHGSGDVVIQPNLEAGADGFIREWDVMGNFPWGALEVLDPVWVQSRWPVSFTPEPPRPALDTLTEDASTALNSSKWNIGPAFVVDGQIHLPVGSSYVAMSSTTLYRLTSSQIYFEAVAIPQTVISGSEAYLKLTSSNNTLCDVELIYSDELLIADYHDVGGTRHRVTQPAYDPVEHRWWRIRFADGMLSWDISADGLQWNFFGELDWSTTGWPLDALDKVTVTFGAGNYQGTAGATDFIFDNINVVSTGTPPSSGNELPFWAELTTQT